MDWSFHPLLVPTRVGSGADGYAPKLSETIGAALVRQARKGLVVAIHTWNHASLAADDQNNKTHEILRWIALRRAVAGHAVLAGRLPRDHVAASPEVRRARLRRGRWAPAGWRVLGRTRPHQGALRLAEHRFSRSIRRRRMTSRLGESAGQAFSGRSAFRGHRVSHARRGEGSAGRARDDWYNAELAKLHEVQVKEPKDFDYRKCRRAQPWHEHPRAHDRPHGLGLRSRVHRALEPAHERQVSRDVGSRHRGQRATTICDVVQKVLTETLANRRAVRAAMGALERSVCGADAALDGAQVTGRADQEPSVESRSRRVQNYSLKDFERSIQDSYVRAIAGRALRHIETST